jgi:lipopolysaccharide heptosyltransferase I
MRILIVKLSSIGDVVHTLPAAALLRRSLPDAHISWVVERRASAILKGSTVIDELIEIDSRAWRKNLFNDSTKNEIHEKLGLIKGVDLAIDFQGLIKSGLVAFASKAKRRIGFETSELREKASRLFLTEQIGTSDIKHIIDKNIALARAAFESNNDLQKRITSADYEFPISVSCEDEAYIEGITGDQKSFAILNPGGGWPTKLWPAEHFGQIADWLREEYKMRSFVTYGPGEESLAQSVASASQSGSARVIASTLKQFVALARRASLFVGGDTGPLHIAAACRTPIVGLYGPTSPERNGPFDARDVTVGLNLWCRPNCHRRSCWHWECMNISVSAVRKAIATRLGAGKTI